MADDVKPAGKPVKRQKHPAGVRFFRGPEVTLIRMGREVATYRGEYARLSLNEGRVEFRNAVVRVGDAELSATYLAVDVTARKITGTGRIRLEEQGVQVIAERVTARLALSGLRFGGTARMFAKDRESAQALLDSGVM